MLKISVTDPLLLVASTQEVSGQEKILADENLSLTALLPVALCFMEA